MNELKTKIIVDIQKNEFVLNFPIANVPILSICIYDFKLKTFKTSRGALFGCAESYDIFTTAFKRLFL